MFAKKTKIVCTIGPSSWDPVVMEKLVENGMNCARVNGAFANPDELDKVRTLVKNVSDDIALMVDVKGPEIRMNKFDAPIALSVGDEIRIGNSDTEKVFTANYDNVYQFVEPGQRCVIGDGDVELVVREVVDTVMVCEVVYGELLKPGKALNLPGVAHSSDVLTPKDIENLQHAIDTGWDFVSASFIQTADAAREVNKYLEGSHMKLIAKIEDQEGVDNIDEILEEVEGIMIARGGLGIELGLETVPMVQRYLTERANAAGKPVITATQMLETMITQPRPTRAEVNDVATAIMIGSDAVMLSAESSAGEYPVEAVATMTRIAQEVEMELYPEIIEEPAIGPVSTDALSRAAAHLCSTDEIDLVIVVSRTGRTARLIGRHSIDQPIFAFVSKDVYARRMMLSKGIFRAFVHDEATGDRDAAVKGLLDQAKQRGVISSGDRILLICKTPLHFETEYFPNVFEVVEV